MPDPIENVQTNAAIADSPFLSSFGDALKSAQAEAATKAAAPAKATPTPATEPAPAATKAAPEPEKAAPAPEKKAGLPEFTKTETPKPTDQPSIKDELEMPAGLSEKSAVHWKKIKERVELAEKRAAELEQKAATATDPKKIADYEAKLKAAEATVTDMSERLKLLAIERHPEFAKKYDTKTTHVHSQLKAIAGTEGEKLVSLLGSPDSPLRRQEIDNIVAGMNPTNQSKFGALMVKLEDINMERNSEIEATKAKFEEYKESVLGQQKVQTEESKARAQQIWNKVSAEARALELFEPKDGDEKWNNEVNERLQTAQQIFNGESGEEELAKAALWAASAPKYRELVYTQGALIQKLQAELASYKESDPEINSSTAKASVEKTFMEKLLTGVK